jgi:cell wall assembly regulator SMI1
MAKVNVAECWAQIERWLAEHMPAAFPMLPAGASTKAFAQAEKTLGYPLPRELKEFLAIHDGSATLWLHDRGEFMSLEGILAAWDQEFDLWGDGNNDDWATPQGPIKKKWFTRKWLPILDARTGDHVCVDLDPPKGGKRGQIITWYHDNGPTEVIATSFGALLAEFVTELESGLYMPQLNQAGQPYLEYAADRA